MCLIQSIFKEGGEMFFCTILSLNAMYYIGAHIINSYVQDIKKIDYVKNRM